MATGEPPGALPCPSPPNPIDNQLAITRQDTYIPRKETHGPVTLLNRTASGRQGPVAKTEHLFVIISACGSAERDQGADPERWEHAALHRGGLWGVKVPEARNGGERKWGRGVCLTG